MSSKFRNFWDCESFGGDGSFGSRRSDEYDGGVCPVAEELDVVGRIGRELEPTSPRKSDDDARSLGLGEPLRDRERSSSFNRFVRSSCSNCTRRSFAHASSNSCVGAAPPDGGGPFQSAMCRQMWRLSADSTSPVRYRLCCCCRFPMMMFVVGLVGDVSLVSRRGLWRCAGCGGCES